jgi:hypothetical protein
MPTNTTHPYCRFDEARIRQSGLLSPARLAEVTAEITARIEPSFDKHGHELPDAKVVVRRDGQRIVFSPIVNESNAEFLRQTVLAEVLTAEEIELINLSALEAIDEANDKDRFSTAQKLDVWSGGVFYRNNYFLSMEELFDHLERESLPWPKYVWAAEPQAVIPELAVRDVVDHYIVDRGWEDMDTVDLEGVSELQEALGKFTAVNSGVVCYQPDFSRAILLNEWVTASETKPS